MMKKVLYSIFIIAILTSCASATANKDNATYLESVDENGTLESIKLVDKESGCKYLVIITSTGTSRPAVTQMLNKDGKPLCK